MKILLLLVPISVVLLGIAIWAFVWAVRKGQFDNLDSAGLDVLVDEDAPPEVGRQRAEIAGVEGAQDRTGGNAPVGPPPAHRAPSPGGRGEGHGDAG